MYPMAPPTRYGSPLDNDVRGRHHQPDQATIHIRCCLHSNVAYLQLVLAWTCAADRRRSEALVLRNKDRKVRLSHLGAIQQDQVLMEQVVVENHSTFRKSKNLQTKYRLRQSFVFR